LKVGDSLKLYMGPGVYPLGPIFILGGDFVMQEVVTPLEATKKRVPMSKRAMHAQIIGMCFAAPAVLGFLIFNMVPMFMSLYYSFTDYSIIGRTTNWVGLDNYVRLLTGQDPHFFASVRATAYFVVLSVPSNLLFAFGIAILLNRKMVGRSLFRAIFYLPSIVPFVASAFVWLLLFNPDFGLANQILRNLGLPTSMFFLGRNSVIPTIVFMGLWGTGATQIIFLAGLQEIPTHYYEALEIDGGHSAHKFLYITLPMITPTLFFNLVMGIIGAFQVFAQAFVLTRGGPNNASLFYVFQLWRTAFTYFDMGTASAMAWLLFIVILAITGLVFRTSNKWIYYEGGDKE